MMMGTEREVSSCRNKVEVVDAAAEVVAVDAEVVDAEVQNP